MSRHVTVHFPACEGSGPVENVFARGADETSLAPERCESARRALRRAMVFDWIANFEARTTWAPRADCLLLAYALNMMAGRPLDHGHDGARSDALEREMIRDFAAALTSRVVGVRAPQALH